MSDDRKLTNKEKIKKTTVVTAACGNNMLYLLYAQMCLEFALAKINFVLVCSID